MARRSFTVQEANSLIPAMEGVIQRTRGVRARMERGNERLQLLDALWGARIMDPENPDRAEFLEIRKMVRDAIEEVEEMIRTEVLDRGIRFPRGGLEHGLLDFPTTYDGRWVYLCWRIGEKEIRQWHEVHAGFQGRKHLTRDQKQLMGRVDDPSDLDDSLLDF